MALVTDVSSFNTLSRPLDNASPCGSLLIGTEPISVEDLFCSERLVTLLAA